MATSKSRKKNTENAVENTTDDHIPGVPDHVRGQRYLFAVPGGFTMFGWYVRELGMGQHRFARVRHMRNAGTVELTAMCRSGPGEQTVFTTEAWEYWDGTPLWEAPWNAPTNPSGSVAPDDDGHLFDLPANVRGQWYMFAVPGGFTMFGRYVRELGMGRHQFARVRHMRNAGTVELPAMCQSGFGPQTRLTNDAWEYWNGVPLWKTPWNAFTDPTVGARG